MAVAMLTIYKQHPLWCFPVLAAKEVSNFSVLACLPKSRAAMLA